jgi:hypothetical protein
MIADIAAVFHWPLSEIEALPFDRLIEFRGRAVDWWNNTHSGAEG